ncbi:hypothetical protein SUDANB121_05921 (plasmid) [Nocardiopsis dassonvillei]|uniref:hypothetical protein n=1 Tax=Nocardiopsis dassonvillei TaxID=2014 RepID=UPI003F5624BB
MGELSGQPPTEHSDEVEEIDLGEEQPRARADVMVDGPASSSHCSLEGSFERLGAQATLRSQLLQGSFTEKSLMVTLALAGTSVPAAVLGGIGAIAGAAAWVALGCALIVWIITLAACCYLLCRPLNQN